MIILEKHSLTRAGWFPVESCQMSLEEKKSQISLTVGPEAPDIATGTWLMEDEEPGAGIVWRVKTIEDNYNTATRTITAEHIINTLKDTAIFGEVTPDMMGGSETSCTAEQAARYAIGKQSDWRLARIGYNQSAGYTFNGDSIMEALETVSSTLENSWWSYDLSSYPFKLTIAPKESEMACEMRAGRNITTIKRTIDTSRMYTRIYPIGKENLHITGDYLSRNENLYGTIMKVETDQGQETEEMLRLWADGRLRRHCEPSVTISISGIDLSEATGESLDKLQLGKACRVPLPEYGTTILENIIKIQWRDKKKEPENVTLTLANAIEDVASIIRQEREEGSGSSGRGGRAGAKAAEEDHAWFVDTTDHVGMVAESIVGRDPETGAVDWSRVSSIIVDGTGIHDSVVEAQNDIVVNRTNIDINERGIAAEIVNRENADNTLQANITATAETLRSEYSAADGALSSSITQTATAIRSEVNNYVDQLGTRIDETDRAVSLSVGTLDVSKATVSSQMSKDAFPKTGQAGTLYYDQTEKQYYIWNGSQYVKTTVTRDKDGNLVNANYIKAGEIVIAINEDGSTSAKLDATRVLAGKGALTINDLELPDWMDTTEGLIAAKASIVDLQAVSAKVSSLEADKISTDDLSAQFTNLGSASIATLTAGTLYIKPNGDMGGVSVANALSNLKVSLSGNTYTLQGLRFNSSSWEEFGTFSRATTLTGSWSSGTYTVTASPQGTTLSITPGLRFNGNGTSNFSAEMYSSESSGAVVRNSIYGYLTLDDKTVHVRKDSAEGGVVAGIDVSSVWDAAEAQFEKHADITPISTTTITVKNVVRYKEGEDFYYYPGDGGKFTVQGDEATSTFNGTLYYSNNEKAGTGKWFLTSTTGKLYKAGSTTKYARGTQGKIKQQGSAIAAYVADSDGTTWYQPGTKVTGLYTKK